MILEFIPEAAKTKWDAVEVHPVWQDENGNCDVVDEGNETFWSVYLHQVQGGVLCVADLPTKELALKLAELIENCANAKLNATK
jgi:hypothetical protein